MFLVFKDYVILDKGAYWRKCCDGNYSFLEWKVDPTEFTNNDFKLKRK